MTQEHKLGKLKYLIRYPQAYQMDNTYPVILFFHGSGNRGTDVSTLNNNAFICLTEQMADFPFICVIPLCSENTWFDLWEHIMELARKIPTIPGVDVSRIYLAGTSMGGYAVWQLAMSMPEYFAAMLSLCGGGMYWNAGRLVNIPVWAFHGAKDKTVLPEESQKMVDRVNAVGGNARLTIYPDCDHNVWDVTYGNPEVFDWLLQYRNSNAKTLIDEYTDSNLFG